MRLSKCFTSFIGIPIFCVALLISKRFICCDISSAVIGLKENLFISTVDSIFSETFLHIPKLELECIIFFWTTNFIFRTRNNLITQTLHFLTINYIQRQKVDFPRALVLETELFCLISRRM